MKYFNRARIKNYSVILLTIVLLSFVWHYISTKKPWELDLAPIENNRPDIVMKSIQASQVSGKRIYWEIDSEKAVIRGKNVYFSPVTGNLFDQEGRITFKFFSPEVEMKASRTIFSSIKGITTDGTKVFTKKAYWLESSNYLSSPHPVRLLRDEFKLVGQKLYLFPEQNKTLLTDGVQLLEDQGRITINSTICELYSKKSFFKEDVQIDYGELQVSAHLLEISRADKLLTIPDSPSLNYKGNVITADLFYSKLGSNISFLSGNVRVSKEDTLINADQAIMDNQKNMIEFTGNINGTQNDNRIVGEKAEYNPETKQIKIEGRARIIKLKE